jgi:hypothetical protein
MFVRNRQREIGKVSLKPDALTGELKIVVFWIAHGKGISYDLESFYWEWEPCDPPLLVCEACRKTVNHLVDGLCNECQIVEAGGHDPREMRVWVWPGASVRHWKGDVAKVTRVEVQRDNMLWFVEVLFPDGSLGKYPDDTFFNHWEPYDAAKVALEPPSIWDRLMGEDFF